ncbi:MAG: hypothetical protein ILNGONEN_00753 [Syntrophorhabdaceae bacterium]|nr:hypothetical protein [Syntrophorhabdaceae bacterium]
MSNGSRRKHIWFLRHGQTTFDLENCTYDEFIEALSNGYHTPLHENHGINFASLPQNAELICYSPTRRAEETTEKLQEHLNVGLVEKMELLREVKFDKDIIRRNEYKSLKNNRRDILTRWFKNENKSESFQESMARVSRIEKFLQNRQEESIILVTHGWILRLLEIYFVHGKREDITLFDLLNVEPIKLGQFVEAKLKFRSSNESNIHIAEVLSTGQKHFEFENSKYTVVHQRTNLERYALSLDQYENE